MNRFLALRWLLAPAMLTLGVAALGLAVAPGCQPDGSDTPGAVTPTVPAPTPPVALPGWDVPANPNRPWKWIVIHHSAYPSGSYAAIDNYHRDSNKWDGCGYHFVIGNGVGSGSADGLVEVGHRWTLQKHGAHAGAHFKAFNEHGIGICLIGNFDVIFPEGSTPAPGTRPTPAQLESLAGLVHFLTAKYNIPPENVIGHKHVRVGDGPPRETACPGRYFSMAALHARLDALAGRPPATQQPLATNHR